MYTMLGYTVQTGDSGDKPRSQEESKKEVSSNGKEDVSLPCSCTECWDEDGKEDGAEQPE